MEQGTTTNQQNGDGANSQRDQAADVMRGRARVTVCTRRPVCVPHGVLLRSDLVVRQEQAAALAR